MPMKRADDSATKNVAVAERSLKEESDLRVVQGVAFVFLMGGAMSISTLRRWPWVWLAPLGVYFLLIGIIPRWRPSLKWLRFGRMSAQRISAMVGIMALTTAALVAFSAIAKPDLSSYRAALPFERFGGVITAGVIFTVVNAILEELVFRGVLFDAIRSQWNVWVTLIATSVLFGLGHLHGFPPGLWGACLAVGFGFAVGVLRVSTDGLALPIVAHMGADATIYWILVNGGVA
jgi:membrane protease YdiL (CAAX protease family)